ncbi:type VI secretion system baseplate subunit TssF [Pantoea sp.]|uniref:type VI secretion system baseplate subunit TssF n=1 Tax=Pantoea sp. TaxID=69393 RepID=UPI0031E11ED7
MNPQLLDYYNRELNYLREMGAEFADRYPKVAGRLGMQGIEVADPYTERLMEGFAFLTSRVQLKMDAEFPRFTEQLLEMIYPNYLAPTPSMAIVEFQPDHMKGKISSGFTVPRGSLIENQALKSKGISCKYRTAHDVNLLPLQLSEVTLGGLPANLPLSAANLAQRGAMRALRIRLKTTGNIPLHQLAMDDLRFHLSAGDLPASRLMELLMAHCVGVLYRSTDNQHHQLLEAEALQAQGFAADEALLPDDLRGFSGYRLLQEYFAFPARFLFMRTSGLQPLVKQLRGATEMEIVLLLDKADDDLENRVDVSHLALHCTPAINLFPRVAERIQLTEARNDYHLVVDNTHPLDYEVFSINRLYGSGQTLSEEQIFRPFWHSFGRDNGNYGAYFSQRREPRALSDQAKVYGTRTGYAGSELFVTLVDEQQSPWSDAVQYVMADVLCTNRDLPLMLMQHGMESFTLPTSAPVLGIHLRKGPTAPRPALAAGAMAWRLMSQLQLNYLSLMESEGDQGAASLRQLLALYANTAEAATARQIEGVRHCEMRPVFRRVPEPGPIVFARGIAITLTLDEQAFGGASPWLLGSVLAILFSRMVAINTFTELTINSDQRGEIGYWPPQMGKRPLL